MSGQSLFGNSGHKAETDTGQGAGRPATHRLGWYWFTGSPNAQAHLWEVGRNWRKPTHVGRMYTLYIDNAPCWD